MMRLTRKEVQAEIAMREGADLDRRTLQDLANLYIVRDKLFPEEPVYERGYSRAPAPVEQDMLKDYGSSDFLQAVSGKSPFSAWAVMDELMDDLRAVNPKVYESVMRKVREL